LYFVPSFKSDQLVNVRVNGNENHQSHQPRARSHRSDHPPKNTHHTHLSHTLSITTHPYPGRHLRDSTLSSGRTIHAFPITPLRQTRRRTGRVESVMRTAGSV
jgi:hypothetical protein